MSKNTNLQNEILKELIIIAKARKNIDNMISIKNTESGLETMKVNMLININEDSKERENKESVVMNYSSAYGDIMMDGLQMDGYKMDLMLNAYETKWDITEAIESMKKTGNCKDSYNAKKIIKLINKTPKITEEQFFKNRITIIKEVYKGKFNEALKALAELCDKYCEKED